MNITGICSACSLLSRPLLRLLTVTRLQYVPVLYLVDWIVQPVRSPLSFPYMDVFGSRQPLALSMLPKCVVGVVECGDGGVGLSWPAAEGGGRERFPGIARRWPVSVSLLAFLEREGRRAESVAIPGCFVKVPGANCEICLFFGFPSKSPTVQCLGGPSTPVFTVGVSANFLFYSLQFILFLSLFLTVSFGKGGYWYSVGCRNWGIKRGRQVAKTGNLTPHVFCAS